MTAPQKSGARWLLPTLVLAAAALGAYWPVLHNGFVWDDDRYIQGNVQLLTARGLGRIWFSIGSEPQYYPLTHTTFWLEYRLWRGNPLPYHLDNLLLHTASAIVLWRLLRRLQVPGAWFAALLFCVHPVQVESVAWATERKNVLSGLLYLLALWAYLRNDLSPRWRWYLASLFLFGAALLSKSVTATLPAAILLILWWKRGRIVGRDIRLLVPFFLAAAAMGSLTAWMEKHVVGAVGPDFPSNFLQRLCIAARAPWFYLSKLIWPTRLTFMYPRWTVDPIQRPWLLLFALCTVAAITGLWLLRQRLGRGPLTAWLYFLLTLFPALGFANFFPMRYSYVADHFQYLACIGPIALFSAGICRWLPRLASLPIGLVIAAIFCVLANRQCRVYHDLKTLWADTLAKNPAAWAAHVGYGEVLREEGDLDAAEAQFRRALQLRPDDGTIFTHIGLCYAMRGDDARAIRCYQRALELLPDSPEPVVHRFRAEPYYYLGIAYTDLADRQAGDAQDRQLAIDAYRRAIQIEPNYELAMINLGLVYASEQRYDDAIDEYRQALLVNPDSVKARNNLGNALIALGRWDEAMDQYRRVLQDHPDNAMAHNGLGAVYARREQWPAAIEQFQAAIRIDPGFDVARHNLLSALSAQQKER